MNKEFALDPGGPKRLKVTYAGNLANAQVSLDGQTITSFASKEDFQRGSTCKLPDGSMLTVRYGPVEGAPFLKGVHVVRNGAPVAGSAADAVPTWAWVFIVACGIIPILSLGGAIPAVIAVMGVSATLSVSRLPRWSVALRAITCTAIAVACWVAFGALITAFRPATTSAKEWKVPFTTAIFMSSSPEKLMDEIDAAYTRRGYTEKAISSIKDNLQKQCDLKTRKECVDFLRYALRDVETRNPQ